MVKYETETIRAAEESLGSRSLLWATGAYAVLGVAGLVAVGTFPAATETGEQMVAWFRESAQGVRWFVWTWTVAILPLAIMITSLRRLLPVLYRDVYLIGAISYLVAIEIATWSWAGLAVHADHLNPDTARTVLDVVIFLGPVLTGSTTTMMAPVTLLALRGLAQLPPWLGVLGVVAFLEQAAETITIFGTTGFIQPGGAMNMQLGAMLTLTWLLAFGVWGGIRPNAMARAEPRAT
jgi:hypothetical protein